MRSRNAVVLARGIPATRSALRLGVYVSLFFFHRSHSSMALLLHYWQNRTCI